MGTKTRSIKNDKAKDGRTLVHSTSRPRETTTNFTMRGDSLTNVGDGKPMKWDFSNSDDIVTDSLTTPIPADHKRKRIEVGFSDEVWIKEGTLYWKDAAKGCYIDFWVICKAGGYYVDPNGTIPASALGKTGDEMYSQASVDTPVTHYVNYHCLIDSCTFGDELNTEGAMEDAMPKQQNGYMLWIEITTPDADNSSCGCAEVELYRKRTLLLPGESL